MYFQEIQNLQQNEEKRVKKHGNKQSYTASLASCGVPSKLANVHELERSTIPHIYPSKMY